MVNFFIINHGGLSMKKFTVTRTKDGPVELKRSLPEGSIDHKIKPFSRLANLLVHHPGHKLRSKLRAELN
jgi:hypothetical protein